jgi:LPXTG-motif cell wall-anchored protein
MKNLVIPMTLLLALSVSALADSGGKGSGGGDSGGKGGKGDGVKGAPGPLVGAGLPVLLVAGGVYWLVRRRKSAS